MKIGTFLLRDAFPMSRKVEPAVKNTFSTFIFFSSSAGGLVVVKSLTGHESDDNVMLKLSEDGNPSSLKNCLNEY
jgi:hypothetical protein